MDFSGKARKTIFKILARSIKRKKEYAGVIFDDRVISTIAGNLNSVTLPYNKKYKIYYHTHIPVSFSYEDLCPFHYAMPPSGIDLISHVYTTRAHITEYIFTSLGYYKITNQDFNTTDDLVLKSLQLYFTMMGVLFYLRDNVSHGLQNDIQTYLDSINTIDINLIPSRNSLFGKLIGLAIDREFPLNVRLYSIKQLIETLQLFDGKKILNVSFTYW